MRFWSWYVRKHSKGNDRLLEGKVQNLQPTSPVAERSNDDEVKNELETIFVIVLSWQGQSLSNRKDADLRSVMQSREESLREVEKLVQHTETLERKYTDKVITTFAVKVAGYSFQY